ncbi:10836_t:CDS:2, partial [Racocetra persica]
NHNNNNNVLNTIHNSPRAITTANPILTSKIHDKMHFFNGFEDLEDSESQTINHRYVYDFDLETNEKWNETTITEIAEAYFKTLKKERNTSPAAKLLNDQRSRRPALSKIPENQLNYPKNEVEKLFSFEATSPEISDIEESPIAIPYGEDHISESSRKKLLIPALPWISDEGIRIRNLADEVIQRLRVEKLNSGGRHSYITPMPREIIKMDDPRWINMQPLIPAKPRDLPILAWNQVDQSEYEHFDEFYDDD